MSITICVIGAPHVGKLSLVHRYLSGSFSETRPESLQDDESKRIVCRGKKVSFKLYDYRKSIDGLMDDLLLLADGFIIVYSVNNATSYTAACKMLAVVFNVKKWRVEKNKMVNQDTSIRPCVLVGNKTDLTSKVQDYAGIITFYIVIFNYYKSNRFTLNTIYCGSRRQLKADTMWNRCFPNSSRASFKGTQTRRQKSLTTLRMMKRPKRGALSAKWVINKDF